MTRRPVILIVDDDKHTREGLGRALQRSYDVRLAEGAERALEILGREPVDILLSDVRMPSLDGLDLLERARLRPSPPICVLLTAYGKVETAVEAMKRGAYDFLTKPVNLDHLELLLERALRTRDLETQNVTLQRELNEKYGLEKIVSHSPRMEEVFDVIRQAAPTEANVLILGESGTGKELVAHAIHRLSPRAAGPFVAVNCAALAPSLLESELFGHEKGAFTGATERRRGRFEMAHGGTLVIDEISEVDPAIQVKLLRVLEERRFERVGGQEPVAVDIRLISASNRNLKELAEAGKFRQDLFFRLDVVAIHLPPLRERAEDVPLLCEHFLAEFTAKNNKTIDGMATEALNVLASYSWPGNVRELRNVIEKMVVLSHGRRLTMRDVPAHIRQAVYGDVEQGASRGGLARTLATTSIDEAEKMMIFAALKQHGGNRSRAAEQLGISRRTLHRKLKKYRAEEAERAGEG